MYQPEVTIPPMAERPRLVLREPDYVAGELHYCTAVLTGDLFQGMVRVFTPGGVEDLCQVCDGMARDWRGWSGARDWRSIEGHLTLSCSTDGRGHVRMTVTLRPGAEPTDWELRATVGVEAGQLNRLAGAVRAFARSDSSGLA